MKKIEDYQPIALLNTKLVLYKKNCFYLFDLKTSLLQKITGFKFNIKNKIKESLRIFQRLFRMDIGSSIMIKEDEILLVARKSIFHLSIKKKSIREIHKIKDGFSNPLNLCKTIDQTNYIALFGDYGNNAKRQSVSIYGILEDLSVQEVFKFEEGTIRHIHNIIPDVQNRGYFIFTGDNEPEAGIYWADKEFTHIKPILLGTQSARAVCGFVTEKGLLYATDSVSEENKIMLLNIKNDELSLQEITQINGSCIYGTETNKGYYFSTTVEPEEHNNRNKLLSLLSTKKGAGILSNDVHLIHVTKQLKFEIVKRFKKDKLPYKLFQYGAVRFPTGLENQHLVIAYPYALKKIDGNTIIMESI